MSEGQAIGKNQNPKRPKAKASWKKNGTEGFSKNANNSNDSTQNGGAKKKNRMNKKFKNPNLSNEGGSGKVERKKKEKFTNKPDQDSTTEGSNKPAWKRRERPVKKPATLIIKPGQGEKWYSEKVEKPIPEDAKPLSKDELAVIRKRAETLLENDNNAYSAYCIEGDGRADFLWMNKIMKTGTLPDKMAAFTVRIQDSPIHGIHSLQQLIGMVKPQGKQQCLMVSDTIRDLFLEDLLPPNQKLRTFESRSFHLQGATEKELILWLFEDRLKTQYYNFIEALRKMCSDQIEKLRGKGISILEQLLTSHPEREDLLLQVLVNKLGDPVKKVGSRALFHLNKVLYKHPQMKLTVVSEIERLLFRNNVSSRARYYSICFLNGLHLEPSETMLAAKLVKVYLAFFKACVKTGEIEGKMMGGLLTGVNRAFPIAKMVGVEFTESLDVLFKIVQLSQFSISIQALALLFQVTDGNPSATDRFYRVLYRKLLDSEICTTSHGVQFLNLIFKSMKSDTVVSRVQGFAKRLLQICGSSPPHMVCAILFLISEVEKTHRGILSVGTIDDVKEFDLKPEPETNESRQLQKEKIVNKMQLDQLMKTTNVRIEEEPPMCDVAPVAQPIPVPTESDVVEVKDEPDLKFLIKEYDPMARNPSFCGADKTFAFELLPLTQHFHPSVALFAQTLLNQDNISYDGNPLKDFTVGRFLDRFVYRNAKTNTTRPEYQPPGLRSVPVNSASYLQTDEQKIPVEEKFFYKFFKESRDQLGPIKKEVEDDIDSDNESVGDEEFDDLMGNYFKSNGAVMSDEEDVDFMSNVKKAKAGKQGKGKKVASDEEDDSEEEDELEEGSGEDEFSGDEDADEFIEMGSEDEAEFDAEDGIVDDDDDDVGGLGDLSGDDSDEDNPVFSQLKSKLKHQSTRKKQMKSLKGDDIFAPAEQFSEMLESNAHTDFSGSHTLINKDNADTKQLKWEEHRDRWAKGYKRSGKPQFKNHAKKRKFK